LSFQEREIIVVSRGVFGGRPSCTTDEVAKRKRIGRGKGGAGYTLSSGTKGKKEEVGVGGGRKRILAGSRKGSKGRGEKDRGG